MNPNAQVRGRTGRITQAGHEYRGRYMWVIEVFVVPEKKEYVLKSYQSLDMTGNQSFATEDQAKKDLFKNMNKTESLIKKVTGKETSSLILPSGFAK